MQKGEFDYLIGNWERTNEEEGKKTFEEWERFDEDTYKGIGYTLKNNDTIWKEQMKIRKLDTIWQLEIQSDKEPIVSFKVLKKTTSTFLAHNPANKFPTHIQYRYFDDTLTAIVSSKEMEIPFIYWKEE